MSTNRFSSEKDDDRIVEAPYASSINKDQAEVTSTPVDNEVAEPGLHRGLKNRHIQMIAIGGVIGTALFIGTAPALADGGPLGCLLGFCAVGTLCYSVMACLGEMIVHTPIPGGHIALAQRYVGSSMSFTMGWFYWYLWTILFPAECAAVAVLIGFWLPDVNPAAWIGMSIVVCTILNSCSVRVFGESEFWFASIKVLLIIGLILGSIIVTSGGNPHREVIGFKFWGAPNGPFRQFQGIEGSLGRFLGFWATLTRAAFGYVGVENVSLAAGEAQDAKNAMNKAIRRVWIRICIFFCVTVFCMTLIMPAGDPKLRLGTGTATSSPFVIAFSRVGIKGLPHVINAAVLTSAFSAGSAHMYLGSRALWALSYNGRAPKIFRRTNKYGVPYLCVAVAFSFGLLAFTAAGAKTAADIFNYFANMVSIVGLISWAGIAYIYLRFYKATKVQGFNRGELMYKGPLQPYLAYYTLIFASVIIIFNEWKVFRKGKWSTADFICGYLPIPLFFICYFGYKFATKSKQIPLENVDLYTNSDPDEYGAVKPREGNFLKRMYHAIV